MNRGNCVKRKIKVDTTGQELLYTRNCENGFDSRIQKNELSKIHKLPSKITKTKILCCFQIEKKKIAQQLRILQKKKQKNKTGRYSVNYNFLTWKQAKSTKTEDKRVGSFKKEENACRKRYYYDQDDTAEGAEDLRNLVIQSPIISTRFLIQVCKCMKYEQ